MGFQSSFNQMLGVTAGALTLARNTYEKNKRIAERSLKDAQTRKKDTKAAIKKFKSRNPYASKDEKTGKFIKGGTK